MKVYTSSMGRHAVCQAVMVLVGMKYIANISLGKDSLAMILLLMEKRYPIDEAVFLIQKWNFKQSIKIVNDYLIFYQIIISDLPS